MLANVTTPLLGVVATAAIGRLGDSAVLGGVAMAALVFDCMFWLFGFLRMGTVALTAQAYGAGDAGERSAVLVRALMTSAAIGLVLIAVQVPMAALIFGVLLAVTPARGLSAWVVTALCSIPGLIVGAFWRTITRWLAEGLSYDGCSRCRAQFEWQRQEQLAAVERWREQMAKDAEGRAN